MPPSRFLTCPDPVAGRPGVDPALVARLLGLPLLPDFHAAGQMLEVRVPWLPVSLWFVPGESAAEALVTEGVSRGRVWTAHELVDLLRIPNLTAARVQTVATAKLEFLGEVVRVTLPAPAQATLPGLSLGEIS